MKVCDDFHRPIVYEDDFEDKDGNFMGCPMCETIEEIKALKKQIKFLKGQIDDIFVKYLGGVHTS